MNIWAEAPPKLRHHLSRLKGVLNSIGRDRKLGMRAVNLTVLSDDAIRDLNRRFLNCDRTTDVIAFPGDDDLLGEIAVSADTARRQAKARGASLEQELMLLTAHGLLHLAGHDDTRLPAWRRMRVAEFEAMVKVL